MDRERQQSDNESRVEVVYALPHAQWLVEVSYQVGMTVADAIEASGIRSEFIDLEISNDNVGIFSRKTTLQATLKPMDRVEIYRMLISDPKEVRRRKAAEKAAQKNRD